jgi:outer membrane murein-binding lipoprotein Lpp
MKRWLFVGAVVIAVVLLGGIANSTTVHSAGETDCSGLESNTTVPEHGAQESDMYAEEDGAASDCPVDDGAQMGGTTAAN